MTQLLSGLFQTEKEFCHHTPLCLYFRAGLSLHSCWLEIHHPCDVTIHILLKCSGNRLGFTVQWYTLFLSKTQLIDHCLNLSPEFIFFHNLHCKADFSAVVVLCRAIVAVFTRLSSTNAQHCETQCYICVTCRWKHPYFLQVFFKQQNIYFVQIFYNMLQCCKHWLTAATTWCWKRDQVHQPSTFVFWWRMAIVTLSAM